ncbi:MAG TPA: hypothetical protein VMK82_03045 [Steroidobacteraceae bacterium]|nr:hypothetical protein [Steroidobacteraceae bacterium]
MTFLSLGTSREQAGAIEGDLIEECAVRGRAWFLAQVALVTLSLIRRTLLTAAAQVLLAGYAIYELALKLQWWGVRPVRLLLRHDLGLAEASVLGATLALWTLAGALMGLLLMRFLPLLGLRAAIVAMVLLQLRLLILDSQVQPMLVLVFGGVPLLAGCVMAHRHKLARPPFSAAST